MLRGLSVLTLVSGLSGCGGDPRNDWVGAVACTNNLAVGTVSGMWSGTSSVAVNTVDNKQLLLKTTLRWTYTAGGGATFDNDYPTTFVLSLIDAKTADVLSGTGELVSNGCKDTLTLKSGTATHASAGKISIDTGSLSLFQGDDGVNHCGTSSAGMTTPGTYSVACTPAN